MTFIFKMENMSLQFEHLVNSNGFDGKNSQLITLERFKCTCFFADDDLKMISIFDHSRRFLKLKLKTMEK